MNTKDYILGVFISALILGWINNTKEIASLKANQENIVVNIGDKTQSRYTREDAERDRIEILRRLNILEKLNNLSLK